MNSPTIRAARPETAPEAYKRRAKEVDALMARLRRQLKCHHAEQKLDPRNWGCVGNLGYVKEQLNDVVVFLSGDEDG